MSNAGKGDKWRKTNFKRYYDNWDLIQKENKQNESQVKEIKKLSTGKTRFIYK